jgi:hypothetical protein
MLKGHQLLDIAMEASNRADHLRAAASKWDRVWRAANQAAEIAKDREKGYSGGHPDDARNATNNTLALQEVARAFERGETPADPVCRCGDRVSKCKAGCALHLCCGGYIDEGHMSDCRTWG